MNEEFHEHSASTEEFRSPDAGKVLRKHRAKKRLLLIILGIVVAGGGYWYLNHSFSVSLNSVLSFGNSAETTILNTLNSSFSAPAPLRISGKPKAGQSDVLTRAGVIFETNAQRKANGDLPPFSESQVLDAIATLRLDDMFQKQYFAHVAPDGGSAENVAKTVGYDYLALGENLALGIFAGDKGVVDAWMGSPGHRANILESHYTQIGVAVRKANFDGENTWIAVQVFGRPASDCPSPDASLKTTIDASNANLNQMASDLASRRAAMDAMNPKSGAAYNQNVDEYNAEVQQYNDLLGRTKNQIAQYNAEVQAFNSCIGPASRTP